MFAGWGSWVARFRWRVLAVALVAVISAGGWGLGVFGHLTEGGYNDPNSESTRAAEVAQGAFGARDGDLVVIYTPTAGKIDDAALGRRIRERLAALPTSAVIGSTSYWTEKSPQYAAKDKSSAIAVITLTGADDGAKLAAFREIDDRFTVEGATARLSGPVALNDASSRRSTDDLAKAELISLPITLILLVFIFGSLVAASLPVLIGSAAVLGSLGVLHAIASHHDVNSFAVNVASLLGFGMAIDYGLFLVGRFREEQADGRTPAGAVRRTVATAGRTVAFSATLLMIALGGLMLFPQGFLKSLAYGGLAAVFLAALLSLTLLPALLAVLGPGIDRLPVRLPRRANAAPAGSAWTRLAAFVLRRPLVVALPILAGLLLLATPIGGVRFGESDERTLPSGDPSRQAIETLKAEYPQFSGDGVQIVLRGGADPSGYADAARQVTGIAQLTAPERAGDVTLLTATLEAADPFSAGARDVVADLRALPAPAGAELLIGGTTARNVDSLAATADRLPLIAGVLAVATLLLLFLAFGSIVLPIKAVVMSALSLTATFGTLIWIFQDGHGAALLGITPAPPEVGIVVLMAAVVFGLSTDYEVFLLSRMVEARGRGASTAEAVTIGLTRTGRVISAAALLLIVVTGAFALSSVTTMRFVGIGMIIALLLDATVVRMLLVPAVLRLLGDAAWWAPASLRRFQQRAGFAEYAAEHEAPAIPPGRHAAPDDPAALTAIVGHGAPAAAAAPAVADAPAPSGIPVAPDTTALSGAPVDPGATVSADSSPGADMPLGSDRSAQGEDSSWAGPSGEQPALPAATVPLALAAGPGNVTAPQLRIVDAEPSTTDVPSDATDVPSDATDVPSDAMSPGAPDSYPSPGSAEHTHIGRPASDDYFFAPPSTTYGVPIEPPTAEPAQPWERPAADPVAGGDFTAPWKHTAGGLTAADPATTGSPDDADLGTTRGFTTPDPDATRITVAADVDAARHRAPDAQATRRRAPEPDTTRRRAPDPDTTRRRAPDPDTVRRTAAGQDITRPAGVPGLDPAPDDIGTGPRWRERNDQTSVPAQRRPTDLSRAVALRRSAGARHTRPAHRADDPAEHHYQEATAHGGTSERRTSVGMVGIPSPKDPVSIIRVPSPQDQEQDSTDEIPAWRPREELGAPLPLRRPAMLGEQPYSYQPPARPQPNPPAGRSPARPQPNSPAETSPARPPEPAPDTGQPQRPTDLRDHLRGMRPADLAQYDRIALPPRHTMPAIEPPGPETPAPDGRFAETPAAPDQDAESSRRATDPDLHQSPATPAGLPATPHTRRTPDESIPVDLPDHRNN